MSSVSSARGKRQDVLQKKVPENPKFKHVRPTVDTGASITKHLEKLEELKKNYKFRKDEIFKRMKVTTFVQLILQVADYDSYDTEPTTNGTGDAQDTSRPDTADLEIQKIQSGVDVGASSAEIPPSRSDTSRSKLEEVIRGVGEADLNCEGNASKPIIDTRNCPYLLLDVREKDAFDECHIITAQSYPTAMLARSVNYESKDMLRYKNQEGRIIVIYDNDETLAPRAATTLVERGYDNLFMLSGGLKVAHKIFPEGLITGTVPASLSDAGSGNAGRKKNAPSTQAMPEPANQTDFTLADVDALLTFMDSALGDSSSGSRLSQRGKTPGRMSTVSTTSRMTVGGRPAFKP